MNRKIELDSKSAEAKIETLEQRQRRELIEDCPSFDLGFDGTTQEETIHVVKEEEKQGTVEEHVIISSNDDSGDSLDKILATIELPTRTLATKKIEDVQGARVSPIVPNNYTPIPQAHQKRVIKQSRAQKSPFFGFEQQNSY